MTEHRSFKHTQKPYVKPTQSVQETASLEKPAITKSTSENGAKNSGTHSVAKLQYGKTSFSESAKSQNGGASVINISDKGHVIKALHDELNGLEQLQLKVGEQMSVLLFEQMRLAEKCRIINRSMETLLK